MVGKIVLDTNALVYYLQGEEPWVQFIHDLKDLTRYASVITRLELLSKPGIPPEEEDKVLRFLSCLDIVPLDDQVERTAILLRRECRLKTPDAMIAASAITLGARLVTGDESMQRVVWPGFSVIFP